MKKLGRVFLIIVVIGVIGYGFFFFFVSPSTNNDTVTLTRSYFDNIKSENLCEDHFNSETVDYCETFQGLIEDEDFTVDDMVKLGQKVVVTLNIDDNTETFEVTFISEENTGIKGFFHSTNYYIDTIE